MSSDEEKANAEGLYRIREAESDLREAEKFYHDFLGLKVTGRSGRGTVFFAVGDYHHHIATNTWAGKARPARNAVGPISYRLALPTTNPLAELKARAASFG